MYKLVIIDKNLSETEVIRVIENIKEIVTKADIEMPHIHVRDESDKEPSSKDLEMQSEQFKDN